jgi:hypothetical protein
MQTQNFVSAIQSVGEMLDGQRNSCKIAPTVFLGSVQITTDGHRAYLEAVEGAFGMDVDYAQLQKIYGGSG